MVDGEYRFDFTQIQEAHNACWRAFYEAMQRGDKLVVVDNTNTSNDLVGAYWSPAVATGYEVEIVQLTCSHDTAVSRCQRDTPPEVILQQHEQLMSCPLPPYWKNYRYVSTN